VGSTRLYIRKDYFGENKVVNYGVVFCSRNVGVLVLLETTVTYDERVRVEKVKQEAPSCFRVGRAGLWVWCTVLQLMVWVMVFCEDMCMCVSICICVCLCVLGLRGFCVRVLRPCVFVCLLA